MQFSLLLKPVGEACNLDCEYCFYRHHGHGGQFTHELFEDIVRLYEPHVEQPVYTWQGGEPTLWGLENFEDAISMTSATARHSIQTNGLLLDPEWCRSFRKNNVLVGVSLDGPGSEKRRMDVDVVCHSIGMLQDSGVHTNILCVFTNETTRGDAEWLGQFGVPIRFIPQKPRDGSMEGVPSPQQLEQFFRLVVPDMARRGVQVLNVEAACRALMGQPTDCELQPECGPPSLVIEPGGGIYPCDHFVVPEWLIGNVNALAAEGRGLGEFYKTSRGLRRFRTMKGEPACPDDVCPACPSFGSCHRGCPADRPRATERLGYELSLFCEGHKEVGRMASAAAQAYLRSQGMA